MKKILLSFVGLLAFSVLVSGDTFFPKVPLLDRISTITAGSNVTVTKTGSTYTISASTGAAIDADGIRASSGTWSGENTFSKLIQNGNIIDVRAYGAVGDGDTDDAAAIQAAIDASAGKVVYLPAATYRIDSGLIITAEDTKIIGDGKDLTIIESHSTSPIITITNDEPVIKGLTLYGTGVSTAGISIIGAGAKRGVFEDVTIHHCSSTTGTGFYAEDNCWSMRLTRVKSTSNNRGIHLKKNYQNIVVEGCYFNDNTECQVYLSTNTGMVSFNGCLIEDEGYTTNTKGVIIETVKPVVFSNCYHESSSGENLIDFHITGAAQLGIEGMYAVGNDTCTNSIVIDGAASVTIKDSHFTEYVSTAIVNHNASAQYSIINCNIDKLGKIDSTSKNYGLGNQLYITTTGLRYDRPGTTSANLFVSTHTYMTIPSRLGIDTADGSDTSSLMIIGAGATSGDYERAAIVQLYGNDHESTGYQGRLNLCAGNASGSNPGDGAVRINTSDAARVSILKDGKVGIGTTAPSDTLEVAGNIRNLGYGLATSSIAFADGTVLTSTAAAANALSDNVNYNIPGSSMTLSQLTLVGGGTATGITGDIPEISTVTYARINTIQFNDGTVMVSTAHAHSGVYQPTGDYALNRDTGVVDWSKITNIPAGFADGVDNTAEGSALDHVELTSTGTLTHTQLEASIAGLCVSTGTIADNLLTVQRSTVTIGTGATQAAAGNHSHTGTMDVYASTAAYLSNITISAPFAFSSTQTFITSFSTRPVSNVCDKAFTISTATFCIRGGTSAKIRLFIRGQDTSFTTAGTAVFSAAVSATSEARTGGELSNVSVAAGQRLVMVVDEIVGAVTDIICDVKGTR